MTKSIQRLALAGSIALNVALAVWLSRPAPGASGTTAALASASQTNATPAASSAGVASSAAIGGATNATSAPPFRWSEIESDDYRQYIANLRAVGCPEPVIRDLIAADLTQFYAPRAAAIWQRPAREYWRKFEQNAPTPDQLKQLTALSQEQAAIFKELLGVPFSPQEQVDLAFLQVQGGESQLLFLPDDRREAARRVLAEAGQYDKEMELGSQPGGYANEAQQKLFDEKLKLLAQVLTTEETEEFRLRNSPTANSLRGELQYFDCTPEEFKRLLDAREQGQGKVVTGDYSNRGPATDQVRALLGEERAKEFAKVTDMYYQNARRDLENAGLPVERADDAWRISQEAIHAADRLAKDTASSAEERKRQVRALREQTDQRLNAALGEKVARGTRQNLGVVLSVTEANIKP